MFGFRGVTERWPKPINLKPVVMNRIDIKPQNIEQGIMNVEVLKAIKIRNSKFRVRYSIFNKISALLKACTSAESAAIQLPSTEIFEKKVTWMLFDLKFKRV